MNLGVIVGVCIQMKSNHKYKVLILVKNRYSGDIDSYEHTYMSIRELKHDIWYRYKVSKIKLVSPELYQGSNHKYEISVFIRFSY